MDEEKQVKAPTIVSNRDIPLLVDVLNIMQDICAIERRREWQKERLYNITSHITGMPRGGGGGNLFDNVFSELSVLDEEYAQKTKQYLAELKRAERIMNGISSRSMRTFVMMKYLMDLPKSVIMRDLNMTKWGYERATQSVESAKDMSHVVWRERYILVNAEQSN